MTKRGVFPFVLVVPFLAIAALLWLYSPKMENGDTKQLKVNAASESLKPVTIQNPLSVPKFSWPEKARFAVTSQDGKTVAFMDGRDIVVAKGGVEQYRIKSVKMRDPHLAISADGGYLAARCLFRNGIVLWSIEEMKEEKFFALNETSSSFKFEQNQFRLREHYEGGKDVSFCLPIKTIDSTAIVSDNGHVVVVTKNGEAVVTVDGKETKRQSLGSLQNLQINRNGSLLAAYDVVQKKAVLMDEGLKVLNAIVANSDVVYKFSKCGRYLAVLNPGDKSAHLLVRGWGWDPTELVSKDRYGDYELKTLYWYNHEPTEKPCLNLIPQGWMPNPVQWELDGDRWHQLSLRRVIAAMDQGYDFDKEGNLTKHAPK